MGRIGDAMNRFHRLAAPAAAFLTAAAPVAAADTQDSQIWTSASVTVKLTDSLKLQDEFVARFSDSLNGLYEIENSTLLGVQLNDKVSAWAGYVHNPSYVGGDFTGMEHRFREQLVFDNVAAIGKAKVSARLRAEQRWRDGFDGTGWRIRPYVKLGIPLGGPKAPTLNLAHEEFINLNKTLFQTVDGVDRMRNSASLSIPLTPQLKGEVGYLNQYKFVRAAPDTMDHALTAGIGFAF